MSYVPIVIKKDMLQNIAKKMKLNKNKLKYKKQKQCQLQKVSNQTIL